MLDFKTMLSDVGLTKAELARRLGLSPTAVSAWKNSPPQYAIAYLELYRAYKKATL